MFGQASPSWNLQLPNIKPKQSTLQLKCNSSKGISPTSPRLMVTETEKRHKYKLVTPNMFKSGWKRKVWTSDKARLARLTTLCFPRVNHGNVYAFLILHPNECWDWSIQCQVSSFFVAMLSAGDLFGNNEYRGWVSKETVMLCRCERAVTKSGTGTWDSGTSNMISKLK